MVDQENPAEMKSFQYDVVAQGIPPAPFECGASVAPLRLFSSIHNSGVKAWVDESASRNSLNYNGDIAQLADTLSANHVFWLRVLMVRQAGSSA
jgi:hypothetical protein